MTKNESFLMSSSELSLMVAASGIKNFLTFKAEVIPDRSQQIRAISRLVNEGFLIQSATGLRPGPSLEYYLEIIANAPTSIIVKTKSEEAPPYCVYSTDWNQEIACIAPYENRPDTYKIYTTTADELLVELETMHILPDFADLSQTQSIELNNSGFEDQVHGLMKIDSSETNDVTNLNIISSVFRKYELKNKSCVSVMKILSDTITNAIVFQDDVILRYSRENILSWLRGPCNDFG